MYSGKITSILFIISKPKAGIVNSVVYVTIVFLSCRWGLEIFVTGGLTDCVATVIYCRQGNSLKRSPGVVVLPSVPSLGIYRTINFAAFVDTSFGYAASHMTSVGCDWPCFIRQLIGQSSKLITHLHIVPWL